MLAVSAVDDAEMFTLIVTNHASTPPNKKFSVTLPADASLLALHEKCAEEAQLVPGTFELCRTSGDSETVHRLADMGAENTKLCEVGITNKMRMQLRGVNGGTPLPSGGPNSSTAAAALGQVALWSSNRGAPISYGPLNIGRPAESVPNAAGFVGLVNQGATCYLSSLLQSLFMTPDFRRVIYEAATTAATPSPPIYERASTAASTTSTSSPAA